MNTARDFVVVDVETSGFDPAAARVLSVAALTITAGGAIEHSMYTLLNPGVDPGPTNIHRLTPATRPHDALDEARVLAAVLRHALARAAELEITLPIRSPATLPPVEFHITAA